MVMFNWLKNLFSNKNKEFSEKEIDIIKEEAEKGDVLQEADNGLNTNI